MQRALKVLEMYPYRVQCVQTLKPPNFPARMAHDDWFLKFIRSGAHKLDNVYFTDEA